MSPSFASIDCLPRDGISLLKNLESTYFYIAHKQTPPCSGIESWELFTAVICLYIKKLAGRKRRTAYCCKTSQCWRLFWEPTWIAACKMLTSMLVAIASGAFIVLSPGESETPYRWSAPCKKTEAAPSDRRYSTPAKTIRKYYVFVSCACVFSRTSFLLCFNNS